MISATILKVIGLNNIMDVVNTIRDHGVCNEVVIDQEWPLREQLERKIEIIGIPEAVNYINLPNNEIQLAFVYASSYSERAKTKRWWKDNGVLLDKEDRIITSKADVLFFEYNQSIFAVFFTHSAPTISHLKGELLLERHWGQLVDAVDFQVDEDLLYWLIYRRTKHQGVIRQGLDITGLNAYLGSSIEGTHSMSAEGERVLELLGTMACIFGNEPFKSTDISVRFNTENCGFQLCRTGHIKSNDKEYRGNFCGTHIGIAKQARICLLIYTVILPALIKEYDNHKERCEWSAHKRSDFIRETGKDILKRVARGLDLPLNTTIQQLLA